MLSDWVDVCLIMVLVVVCVWLSECVMTLSDRLCTAEHVGFVALVSMVSGYMQKILLTRLCTKMDLYVFCVGCVRVVLCSVSTVM